VLWCALLVIAGTLEPAPSLPVATPTLTASGNASSSQPGLLRGASTDDIESVIRRLDAEEAANKRKQGILSSPITNVSFTDVFATDAESARLAEVLTKEYTDNVERKKLAYVDSPFRSVLVLILPHYLPMKCRVRADTQAVRQLLETELKAGRPLKNEEYVISAIQMDISRGLIYCDVCGGYCINHRMNFLNAPADHTEDKDYNCMSCYCDYKISKVFVDILDRFTVSPSVISL
jgi:hypothetical protein